MKTTSIKGMILSGAILMATSLIAFGQNSETLQKPAVPKHHGALNSPQFSDNQKVIGSGNSVYDAGSSAQVRHDRTGSTCPGNVVNVGKGSHTTQPASPSLEGKRQ